ncbi:PKD domain-containing protein, partial [Mesonia mobilis]|uniref:PKD domain-containing protein n=1 Tax=Mesonia mobilis TaxID=369791 RepID=UPI0026EF5345
MIIPNLYSQCSGNFYDNGGENGTYNETPSITTFCPDSDDEVVVLSFTQFVVAQNQDFLIIYDGDSTDAPQIGQFSAISPGIVSASIANETGCLTIEWVPDGNISPLPGWAAEISCRPECQEILVNAITSAESLEDGAFGGCLGEPVDFEGSATFSNGFDENAIYEWDFDNGETANTQDASVTFNEPGVYFVTFSVKDAENCPGGTTELKIQIPDEPIYSSEASSTSICSDESITLTGSIEPVEYFRPVAPPVTGETYLPDGSGESYETCITVEAFDDGETLQNAADLLNIYLNIEHSYTGDLDITITAPNGNEVILFSAAGNGNHFGEPIDNGNDDGIPGVGYDYFFSESANATMVNSFLGSGQSLPSGDYLPIGDFSDLLGTELNGEWCITVTDNILSDDGFIFEWGLNFAPDILPAETRFTPEIVNEYWEGYEGQGSVITLEGLSSGVHCYTYYMEDNFGCDYSEEVCFTVYETPEVSNTDEIDLQNCILPNQNSVTFNLTDNENLVFGDQSQMLFDVKYYDDLASAELGGTPINTTYTATEIGTTVFYVRIENSNNLSCYSVAPFNVIVSETLIATPSDIEACDDDNDGETIFDLTVNEAETLDGQNPNNFTVTYYTSQDEADNGNPAEAISTPSNYNGTTSSNTIYVRVENDANPDCYQTTSFVATGYYSGVINEVTVENNTLCEEFLSDASFDLQDNTALILGGQDASIFNITYHPTLTDAEDATSPLPLTGYQPSAEQETIYVRIENVNNTDCYNTGSFNIQVNLIRIGDLTAEVIEECDEDSNGSASFDL